METIYRLFSKVIKLVISKITILWYNIEWLMLCMGVKHIKRLTPKRKKWLENRSEKIQSNLEKINTEKRKKEYKNSDEYKKIKKFKENQCRFLAPETFSIVNNTDESSKYINNIMYKISKRQIGQSFYFDLSKVTDITCDAIMYMIAIMNNVKYKKLFKYSFFGNKPLSEQAKNLFNESGFLKYVDSNEKGIYVNNNKIQIISGNKVDINVVANICDFVNMSCKTKKRFTQKLYAMIIELMTNTVQHAYNKKSLFDNYWYIFVENGEDTLKFVFLDIGEGIASTVKKKFKEVYIKEKTDSELIYSAFKGEKRSETGESHRGKGLPDIAQECINSTFKNLQVFSGTGIFRISDGEYYNYDLTEKHEEIYGTLFTWEISKIGIKEEYKIDRN